MRFELGGMWRSLGLELNDLGFLRQADRIMQYSWIGTRITKPAGLFRTFNANFNQWWGWHFGGETIFAGGNVNGGGQLKNYWYVWLGVGWEGRNLSTTALRGGPAMKSPAQWSQWYDVSTDGRKPVQFGVGGYNSWAQEGDTRFNEFRFYLSFRPYNAMRVQMNPFYNINKDDLQYVDTIDSDNGDRYLFGRINQKTLGVTFRIDYSVTPDLSIQYYGQPFVSAGEYNQFKRITSPRAANYSDRFQAFANEIAYNADDNEFLVDEDLNGAPDYSFGKPDFNFKQFRSNLVVRWEYSPGSTAFLVWSQSRTGFQDDGEFSFRNDLRGLFDVHPDNVFLVKLNRWFSL